MIKNGLPVIVRIDIMAPGTNKAAGLHVLLNALGLSMAETCAIGDSENDLEMLQSVRVACAMGNAVKKTKARTLNEMPPGFEEFSCEIFISYAFKIYACSANSKMLIAVDIMCRIYH